MLVHYARRTLEAVALAAILFVSMLCLLELSDRDAATKLIQQKIADVDNQRRAESGAAIARSFEGDLMPAHRTWVRYKDIEARLSSLVAGGSNDRKESTSLLLSQMNYEPKLDTLSEMPGAKLLAGLKQLSSGTLVGVAILLAGALGSFASALRLESHLTTRSFLLGLISGFVAYLVLAGARQFLFSSGAGTAPDFNPVGTVLFAFLAGMSSGPFFSFLDQKFRGMTSTS